MVLYVNMMLTAASAVANAVAKPLPPQKQSGTDLTVEGLTDLMLGLRRLVEQLPRYDLPEITENGDITIRRINLKTIPDAPRILAATATASILRHVAGDAAADLAEPGR